MISRILCLLEGSLDAWEAGRIPNTVYVILVYLNIKIIPERPPEPRVVASVNEG